jgi:hypothetical protein
VKVAKRTHRKIMSIAEQALMVDEAERGHLDAVTELGFTLKREIPKGDAFVEWIADEETCGVVVAALLGRGFTWEEVRVALFDLTHWRWLPPVEQLQHNYAAALEAAA